MLDAAMTSAQLTGQDAGHVTQHALERDTVKLQPQVFAAYAQMHAAATADGVQLAVASGFRDFDRQLLIWNRKFKQIQLDEPQLSIGEIIERIMTWSALPGGSRHHWGTDLDVFDPRPFSNEKPLQLIPSEYQEGGPCHQLFLWLCQHAKDYGFGFPYAEYRGGVAAEPWHLSYWAIADAAQQQLSVDLLRATLQSHEVSGQAYVLEQLPELKARYIDNIQHPSDGADSCIFG